MLALPQGTNAALSISFTGRAVRDFAVDGIGDRFGGNLYGPTAVLSARRDLNPKLLSNRFSHGQAQPTGPY